MKKEIFLSLGIGLALTVFGAACGPTADNGHNAMNHDAMNHNAMPMNSNMMNSNMPVNHNSMNHANMQSDASAASAPYDLQFIDTMTAHHEGAIEMAEMVLQKSENAELKEFAGKIIDDQRAENSRLTDWRKQWFADAPPARNMALPGMADSMKAMTPEHMKMMQAMSGAAFDTHFLDMMIPHHEGALAMAKDAQQKAQRAEIKSLAAEIIKEQEAEIRQMNEWKAKWAK